MIKQLFAFILGANLVGSWLATIMAVGFQNQGMWVWPIISTAVTFFILIMWSIDHWED